MADQNCKGHEYCMCDRCDQPSPDSVVCSSASTPGTIYADTRLPTFSGVPLTEAQKALIHQELQWAYDQGSQNSKNEMIEFANWAAWCSQSNRNNCLKPVECWHGDYSLCAKSLIEDFHRTRRAT